MSHKKLMILGGSRYAVPVVEAAYRLGVHVITADYWPDNAAHTVPDGHGNGCGVDNSSENNMERA